MIWIVLLAGVATAAVFLAVPAIRWDLRRKLHQFHVQAVATLVAEEEATDGLAKELHSLDSQVAHISAEPERIQGEFGASHINVTQSHQHPLHDPGGSHGINRRYGPGAPD